MKKPLLILISTAADLLTLTELSGINVAFAQDETQRAFMLSMNYWLFLGLMIFVGAIAGAIFMFFAGAEFLRRRRRVKDRLHESL